MAQVKIGLIILCGSEYYSQVDHCHQSTKNQQHTTGGIPRWSPTLVLVARFSAYVWQSGRDAQFSLTYGRMCLIVPRNNLCTTSSSFTNQKG
jgi:hypothetical protein